MDEVAERCLDRYRQLKADNEQRKKEGLHDYSLIASLLKPSNEVTLHSRFLCSMLNPKGLHYQGSVFLELFLKELPEQLRRFDLERVTVSREKDSIDILIHDGERALIVENKIDAPDQRYQTSRYIGCVQRKLFAGEEDLSDRVAVIYLSAWRSQPSKRSNSLAGFSLAGNVLRWEGYGGTKPHADLPGFRDKANVAIPFHHVPYFPSLVRWAEKSAEMAPAGGIRNAFEEYRLVLERLQKPKSWRKVMSLDSYAMSLPDTEQRDMYAFMIEAQTALDRFIAARLFEGLKALFGEAALVERGPFKTLDEDNLSKWLTKQGRNEAWERVGAVFDAPTRPVALVFASEFAYMGAMDERPLWDKACRHANLIHGGNVRRLLRTQQDGVYRFLDYIHKQAEQCGVLAAPLKNKSSDAK
ncbi:PD-(D/E)XK nuclease family protein [Pseudomonas stutzeri]|uniref:PDDEXK-like family protein n=1 Tax=Stutzerimonas stutzeri TaxID=316 RepID=UPI001F522839|nr:PD-(D/E)XK nuclease family protein [Stutzerimonas stutzeri]MCI0915943.1 PD-(D/E)XK nuclease family protein [Stutzerimonas stutzeri]